MTAAAAYPRRLPPDPRQLQRCLVLAVLLHVWLVLVFGNATGTAAPGQGVWGSLSVKLMGPSGGQPGAPPGNPAPEWKDNGAPGTNPQQRQGGQVRAVEPPPSDTPGAAELGRWNPVPVPAEAARTEALSPATPTPPSTATLALPEGFRPVERQDLSTPARPAEPAQLPTPAAELPTIGRLDSAPAPNITPLPSPSTLRPTPPSAALPTLPADLPAAVNRLDAAPAVAPTLARPSDLRAAPAPRADALPSAELPTTAVQRLEAAPAAAPAPALARAAELRATPAPRAQALPSAELPTTAIQRLEAPTAAGAATVTPLARPSDLRSPGTSPATAATALPNAQDLPAAVRRLESASSAVTPMQQQAARVATPAPGTATPADLATALPGQVAAPAAAAGPARGDPNANPYAAPKASAGSPDAGSRLGPDLAVPPAASASAPRAPLNLSLPRSGDIAAKRGPGLVDLLPQPPERKSKLERSMEEAANPDCRKAYDNAGLLAVVPLAIDAARGKGCKW